MGTVARQTRDIRPFLGYAVREQIWTVYRYLQDPFCIAVLSFQDADEDKMPPGLSRSLVIVLPSSEMERRDLTCQKTNIGCLGT